MNKDMDTSSAKEYLTEKRREEAKQEREEQIEKEVQEYYRVNKPKDKVKKLEKKVNKSNIYSLFASDSDDEVQEIVKVKVNVKTKELKEPVKEHWPKQKMCWADECE